MKRRHRLPISSDEPAHRRSDLANSLAAVGLIDEAFDVALEASERVPDDLHALQVLVNAALASGRLREAQDHLNRWRQLSRDEGKGTCHAEQIDSLVAASDQGLFSEDGVREILRVAASIQIKARVRRDRFAVWESFEEPGSFLMMQYMVTSSAQAADMNFELADRWAQSPTLMAYPGLQFKPMFSGTLGDDRASAVE